MPFLDALGDLDLPLAVEEGHFPHLAQVHPHRIVETHARVDALFGLLRFLLLAFLAGLDLEKRFLARVEELDVLVAQPVVELDDLVRIETRPDELLDLLVENVALVLRYLFYLQQNLFNPVDFHQSGFPP